MEYGAENVKCPFYKSETRNTVKCEGIISETCSNNFSTSKIRRKHYKEKCCNNYKQCKIYRVLELKYYEQLSD